MIEKIVQIAQRASELIMRRYLTEDFEVRIKEDNSPLTCADLDSHNCIVNELLSNFDIPVLSEEDPVDFDRRKDWKRFWLVDPLDGTKDFIARTDEFTVNIALVEGCTPVCGVVAIPARGLVYYAEKDKGAFKIEGGTRRKIYNNRSNKNLICAESRFHTAEATKIFCEKYGINELRRFGSAFKLCKIAEGEVDVYPRLVPTMEWDTAAGHCILNEGGGKLVDLKTGSDMVYNRENLRNNFFIASRRDLSFPEEYQE